MSGCEVDLKKRRKVRHRLNGEFTFWDDEKL